MSEKSVVAELAVQVAALANLVAQQAHEIGELKEFRASVEAQFATDDEALPALDLAGRPIKR